MKQFLSSTIFIFLFLVFILVFWIVGLIYGLNYIFWWYDVVAHFLGGLWIALFANFCIKKLRFSPQRVIFLFTLLGLVAIVGIFWEFAEFIGDRYIFHVGFTYLDGIYEDTLSDFFWDLIGGLIAVLLITNRYESTNKNS